MKKLADYPKLISGSKEVAAFVALFAALCLIAVWGGGKTVLAYQDAMEIKEKRIEMQAYVDDWKTQTNAVKRASYRPVNPSQAEDVQSRILLMLAAKNVDLVSLRDVDISKQKADGKTYEIVLNGAWEDTVELLQNFHVGDALIAIKQVKMDVEKERSIRTALQYKIYVR